jgi:starvation-inducible DNA-binding protein
VRSIGHIVRVGRIADNDADFENPEDILRELEEGNKALVLSVKAVHGLFSDAGDLATASSLDVWIDEA